MVVRLRDRVLARELDVARVVLAGGDVVELPKRDVHFAKVNCHFPVSFVCFVCRSSFLSCLHAARLKVTRLCSENRKDLRCRYC